MSWPDDNIEALRAFAVRRGRRWREDLGNLWWNSDTWRRYCLTDHEAALLHALRNQREYGPGSEFIEHFEP